MTLAEALQTFIDKGRNMHILIATVVDVDNASRTITAKLLTSDAELPDVRLTAVIDSKGSYLCAYPKKDSSVWIAIADNSKEAIVVAFSEVEKYELIIENMKFVTDKDGFIFNNGDNGGVPIVGKVEDNLKAIKDYVTAFKTAVQTALSSIDGSIAGVGGASVSGTAFTTTMASKSMTLAAMNNDKVKH